MFEGKTILITGGTGSLGQALTKRLLESNVGTIRIFSRNENNQVEMENKFSDDRLRFLVGDVRDIDRLTKAVEDVDYIFHAAALKHVPKIEYNPFEAVKTNVLGSQNVIDASLKANIEKVICIGTDKAVSPLNTYGATKLLMEKLFVTANNYLNREKYKTIFSAVRYGNVLGSSGSVIPRFIQQIKNNKKITITDPSMTRFSITMNEALDFIIESLKISKSSEIFVPKLKSYSISEIVNALKDLLGDFEEEIVGIRPGEKLNEILINSEEMKYSWNLGTMYMIANPLFPLFNDKKIKEVYVNIKKIDGMNVYASDIVDKIPKDELKNVIQKSGLLI